MNKRIKELRKVTNLTLKRFGDKLGVTKQTVNRIENGVNNVTDQMFKSICREFNVNEEWLRNGTGEMFIDSNSISLVEYAKKNNLSILETALVAEYIGLDPSIRQGIFDMFYNAIKKTESRQIDNKTEHS